MCSFVKQLKTLQSYSLHNYSTCFNLEELSFFKPDST